MDDDGFGPTIAERRHARLYHERGPRPGRFLTWKGRARRLEFNLINVVSIVLAIVAIGLVEEQRPPLVPVWQVAVALAFSYVGICNAARRCHDFGRSLAELTGAGLPGRRNPWNIRLLPFDEGDFADNDYGPSTRRLKHY